LDQHHKALHDAESTPAEKLLAKEHQHAEDNKPKPDSAVIQNPRSINPTNKLQMSLIKYS
jgi:hypothetical protein